MSNRKYVGLLEGQSEEQQVESAMVIVREYVNQLIDDYLEKMEQQNTTHETRKDIFGSLATVKLGQLLPEYKDKYEVVVGMFEDKPDIYVGHRVCPDWELRESWKSHDLTGNISTFDWVGTGNVTIGGNTITAGTINTAQLNVGGITNNGYIAPIEDATRQLDHPIDWRIGDTVYRNVVVTEPQVTTFTDDQRQRIVDAINESTTNIRIGGTHYNGSGLVNMNAQGWYRYANNESE